MPEIRECYEAWQKPFMEGCVLNAFQDIRFEEPPGGGQVKVRYPIELGPAGVGVDAGAR